MKKKTTATKATKVTKGNNGKYRPRRFMYLRSVTELLRDKLNMIDCTVAVLTRFHIGGGMRKKLSTGQGMSLAQFFTLLRYLVINESSMRNKYLLLAYFFDAMEREFREVYPDSAKPFPGGCEATLRKAWAI